MVLIFPKKEKQIVYSFLGQCNLSPGCSPVTYIIRKIGNQYTVPLGLHLLICPLSIVPFGAGIGRIVVTGFQGGRSQFGHNSGRGRRGSARKSLIRNVRVALTLDQAFIWQVKTRWRAKKNLTFLNEVRNI